MMTKLHGSPFHYLNLYIYVCIFFFLEENKNVGNKVFRNRVLACFMRICNIEKGSLEKGH